MTILPDQVGCDTPQELAENPYHYSRLWPDLDPGDPGFPGYWRQIRNDLLRMRCEEIERDMRRARREADWWRARRATLQSAFARLRARWSSKVGAA